MSDWQEIFEPRDDAGGPGDDFETRVFVKIRRKKTQRKVGMGAAAIVGVVLLLSFFQLFHPLSQRLPLAGTAAAKEEIPVSEELFFSASDSRTRYSLEPVAYQETTAAGATLNQI